MTIYTNATVDAAATAQITANTLTTWLADFANGTHRVDDVVDGETYTRFVKSVNVKDGKNVFRFGAVNTTAVSPSIVASVNAIVASYAEWDQRLTTQESTVLSSSEANVKYVPHSPKRNAPAEGVIPAEISALDASLYQADLVARMYFLDFICEYQSDNGTTMVERVAQRHDSVPTAVTAIDTRIDGVVIDAASNADKIKMINDSGKPWSITSTARCFKENVNGHIFGLCAINDLSDMSVNPYLDSGRGHYIYMASSELVPWLSQIGHLYMPYQRVFVPTSTGTIKVYSVVNSILTSAYLASLKINPTTTPTPEAYRFVQEI
ncbi:hypothetical protein [uncultured Paraglaciecola sp.]|uniref:hypothetical protein n=1 Tax=uncultured Paraglaciecola sp. TaxID=1765024 RepID=UPI002639FD50|nr:hypothetical protein [uncultured Paraglaciecola sp.]